MKVIRSLKEFNLMQISQFVLAVKVEEVEQKQDYTNLKTVFADLHQPNALDYKPFLNGTNGVVPILNNTECSAMAGRFKLSHTFFLF